MNKYPLNQLRDMSTDALNVLLSEKREDLRSLKFKAAQSELKAVHEVSVVKKLIARILTVHNETDKSN